MNEPVACFRCKGSMMSSTTTHVADHGGSTLIIKNAPCLECEKCGETVYEGSVAKRLEQIIDKLESVHAEIAVVKYSETDQQIKEKDL